MDYDLYTAISASPVMSGTMGDALPTLDIADVWTAVGDIMGNTFVQAILVAGVAFSFAPRLLRVFRSATRGR